MSSGIFSEYCLFCSHTKPKQAECDIIVDTMTEITQLIDDVDRKNRAIIVIMRNLDWDYAAYAMKRATRQSHLDDCDAFVVVGLLTIYNEWI